ncbi:23S rRNA (adenine(2503)-C(2))-methyltransferase RlmN [Elusimicrobiota bacterium]
MDIKDLTLGDLEDLMEKVSDHAYTAHQIYRWIYKKGVFDFNLMSNLSKDLRSELSRSYTCEPPVPADKLVSSDKTCKYLFELKDGRYVEAVMIPSGKRNTLCISTQVGCKFRCVFCASGLKGFIRDLSVSEIISQILYPLMREGKKITNYVFMGMGEPFDNYDNVMKAVSVMNEPRGLKIGARNITISTCGIIPGIKKLMETGLEVNLSVSLHAARDDLRNKIVPVNRKYPIKKLINICRKYFEKTGRIVTIEYVLLAECNDSSEDALLLADISKNMQAKINLIPYSPVSELDYHAPSSGKINTFFRNLERAHARVTLRKSRGKDISAACGQLCMIKKHEI